MSWWGSGGPSRTLFFLHPKGYRIEDCVPLIGNEIGRTVTWRRDGAAASGDVSALRGRAVRLRFEIVDADVFAMRFPPSR